MLLNRTNSYTFKRWAVKRWLISLKYFKRYIMYIYILFSWAESYFWTHYTCFVFQQRHIQNFLKYLRWIAFATPVNNFKRLKKHSILDALRGYEYACAQIAPSNVLYHHNKRLMKYFKFAYGSEKMCLPLNIPEKL